MVKDLVSIITPCYNGEEYIGRFLEAILKQTYRMLELILINDGSTDKTEDVVLSYKEKFENANIKFTYIYQENMGQAAAINKGLKVFNGEYLIWPDSDDIIYNDSIEKKVSFLSKHTDLGGVAVQGNVVNEKKLNMSIGILRCNHSEISENIFERLIFEKDIYFAPAGYMMRSSCFLNTVPDREIYISECGQNWQMLLPVAYKYKFGFIDEVLFDYVVRTNSHSRKEKNYSSNIKKTYIHEDCLVQTINKIKLDSKEKERLLFEVKIKYIRKRLNISYQYDELKKCKEYYDELQLINAATANDSKIIFFAHHRFCKKIYIFLHKAKSFFKKVMKC